MASSAVLLSGGRAPGDTEAPAVSAPPMKWCNLAFTVPGPKRVLSGISGQLNPGELACILGPSGAGKTTLLNILGGRQRTTGNGFELDGFMELGDQVFLPEQMRKRVAFVMQDDALIATQTVRESLLFSSALKLPGLPLEERCAKVESLLTGLGLTSCADTQIGSALVKGISGGERKRTSVGVELITNPSLILLDEPTSGLDSFAACQLIKLLKQLTQKGHLVCCTIHQPSSEVFELFDRVMCLRKGEMLYQGQNSALLKVLGSKGLACPTGYNAADWLLYVAQTQDAVEPMDDLAGDEELRRRASDRSLQSRPQAEVPQETTRASFFTQLKHLTHREAKTVMRDKKALGARMGTTIGQAILYAIIFPGIAKSATTLAQKAEDAGPFFAAKEVSECLGNEFGAIVGLSIAAFFGAAQPLLLTFPLERPVFLREYSSNMYSVGSYFLSKTLVELLVTLVQNTILFLVTFWALQLRANFFQLVFSTWLMAISAGSLALWVSCSVSTPSSAIQLAPAISVPQILFSGLFLKSDQLYIPLRYVQYICSLKYAINLLCIGEFGDLKVKVHFPSGDFDFQGTDFLKGQDIDKDMWWVYVLILICIFVFFRILALVSLKKKGRYVF